MSEVNPERRRTLRMSDELWEAMASMADRNGRNTADEIRRACEAWLLSAGGIKLPEGARPDTPLATRKMARRNNKEN